MYPTVVKMPYRANLTANDMEIETILGEVVAKANHYMAVPDKQGGRRIIKDEAIRAYERAFKQQCTKYKDKRIAFPFYLYVKVFYRNANHDLDNSLKTLLDCLQYCNVITNDNLCVQIVAEKHRDPRNPRLEYGIRETQPSLF